MTQQPKRIRVSADVPSSLMNVGCGSALNAHVRLPRGGGGTYFGIVARAVQPHNEGKNKYRTYIVVLLPGSNNRPCLEGVVEVPHMPSKNEHSEWEANGGTGKVPRMAADEFKAGAILQFNCFNYDVLMPQTGELVCLCSPTYNIARPKPREEFSGSELPRKYYKAAEVSLYTGDVTLEDLLKMPGSEKLVYWEPAPESVPFPADALMPNGKFPLSGCPEIHYNTSGNSGCSIVFRMTNGETKRHMALHPDDEAYGLSETNRVAGIIGGIPSKQQMIYHPDGNMAIDKIAVGTMSDGGRLSALVMEYDDAQSCKRFNKGIVSMVTQTQDALHFGITEPAVWVEIGPTLLAYFQGTVVGLSTWDSKLLPQNTDTDSDTWGALAWVRFIPNWKETLLYAGLRVSKESAQKTVPKLRHVQSPAASANSGPNPLAAHFSKPGTTIKSDSLGGI